MTFTGEAEVSARTTGGVQTPRADAFDRNPNRNPITAAERSSEDAVRAAMAMLRDRGIDNPEKVLRLGAAAMVNRCCNAYDGRSGVGPAWLFEAVRHGGAWTTVQTAGNGQRRESASDWLASIDGTSP